MTIEGAGDFRLSMDRIEALAATPAPLDEIVAAVRKAFDSGTRLKHKADDPTSSYDPLARETVVLAAMQIGDAFDKTWDALAPTPTPLDVVPLATQVAVTRYAIDVPRLARALWDAGLIDDFGPDHAGALAEAGRIAAAYEADA
jgi:hypothetical protein